MWGWPQHWIHGETICQPVEVQSMWGGTEHDCVIYLGTTLALWGRNQDGLKTEKQWNKDIVAHQKKSNTEEGFLNTYLIIGVVMDNLFYQWQNEYIYMCIF